MKGNIMKVYYIEDAGLGCAIYVKPENESHEEMMNKLGSCSVLELKPTASTPNAFHIQVSADVTTHVTT